MKKLLISAAFVFNLVDGMAVEVDGNFVTQCHYRAKDSDNHVPVFIYLKPGADCHLTLEY